MKTKSTFVKYLVNDTGLSNFHFKEDRGCFEVKLMTCKKPIEAAGA